MDTCKLQEEVQYANHSGNTLTIDERCGLHLAVMNLNHHEKYDTVYFWGRVKGVEKDYFIIQGVRFRDQTDFPTKTYYWSYDNFVFSPLGEVDPTKVDQLAKMNGYLSGQHDKVLCRNMADGSNQGELDLDSVVQGKASLKFDANAIIARGNQAKPVAELDRLAYLVCKIEHECAVCPVSAFRTTPNDEIRINNAFRGLSAEDNKKLSSYRHFRPPVKETKIDMLSKHDRVEIMNFFDTLEADIPSGAWSLVGDETGLVSYLRNAHWPGFVAYHRANSDISGYAYFGDGRKVCDFPFLA